MSKGHDDSQIQTTPMPAGAEEFSERVHGLLDGQPKDEAAVNRAFEGLENMFDLIAAGLYNLASMLVGEGEAGIRLVETAVATAEVSACHNAAEARMSSRRALCTEAIRMLQEREPGCLAAPESLEPASTCIEDDELDAAGVSSEELETMMRGPDRERVRKWLASLPTATRVIFVLRAVAGFSSAEAAELLAVNGGAEVVGWNANEVREIFRQGLCSLASQLLHATTTR
jgi:hypothetical protein